MTDIQSLVTETHNYSLDLERRALWKSAAIDRALSTFALILSGANVLYAAACTPTFLAMANIATPAGAGATLAACTTTGLLLAASNFASYTLNNYGSQGGWNYDSDSEKSSKRTLGEHHNLILDAGYTKYRSISPNTYLASSIEAHNEIESLISYHCPLWSNRINHHGHIILADDYNITHGGYQFVVENNNHNKSIVSDIEGITSALITLEQCGDNDICIAEGAIYNSNNTSLQKRDSNGFWVSYNDWGFNTGYENDWWQWNEFSKGAQELAGSNKLGIVTQVQSCTNDYRCYGYYNKACFAGGMSLTREDDSAFVGEAYIQSYGGVDGTCDNG